MPHEPEVTDACAPPESWSRTRPGFIFAERAPSSLPTVPSGSLAFRIPRFALESPSSVTLKRKLREAWVASKWGAALAVFLGLLALLLRTPEETPLERWSYDLPYLVRPAVEITNVVIVYMDDATHGLRKQPYDGPWDRSLHARLVNVLTSSG